MKSKLQRMMGLVGTILIAVLFVNAQKSPERPENEVKFLGLKQIYGSCDTMNFEIQNAGARSLYFTVYAEDEKEGAWNDVENSFDLKNPQTLYHKVVIRNPKMLEHGESIKISYDRCMKPRFVDGTDKDFRERIVSADKKATSPVMQRIRVEVHILDHGELTNVEKMYSPSFE